MDVPEPDLARGEPVEPAGPMAVPARAVYPGRFVSLHPLDPERDVADLYAGSHGSTETERLWTYMAYGPFADPAAMRRWLDGCAETADPLFFAVVENGSSRRVGMAAFQRLAPASRCLEIAHLWYVPRVQRTKVNTETVYLMLREAFETLGSRRVEWKCDALNQRSRAAALRLGFRFEGVFRQHLIVKGRNRDTAWYAMLDREWPAVRAALRRWLDAEGEPRWSLGELHRGHSGPGMSADRSAG